MNGIDIAIIILLAAVIAFVIFKVICDKRKGKSCCGGDCSCCCGCDSMKQYKGNKAEENP